MKLLPLAALCALLLSGCGPNIENKEAVREGIMAHLKARTDIDLSGMDVEITSVSFRKGEADATVVFKPTGRTDSAGSMSMAYTLEQKNGKWLVKGRQSTGTADPHGAPAKGTHP